jgi:hypothetical protein
MPPLGVGVCGLAGVVRPLPKLRLRTCKQAVYALAGGFVGCSYRPCWALPQTLRLQRSGRRAERPRKSHRRRRQPRARRPRSGRSDDAELVLARLRPARGRRQHWGRRPAPDYRYALPRVLAGGRERRLHRGSFADLRPSHLHRLKLVVSVSFAEKRLDDEDTSRADYRRRLRARHSDRLRLITSFSDCGFPVN